MQTSGSFRLWCGILLLVLTVSCGTEGTEVADKCADSNLIEQCPPGSNPVLGATADSSCGASGSVDLIYQDGSATGQCKSSGSCNVLCQFAAPCLCGVERITDEGVFCSECPSCGDGLCELPEAESCAGVDDRACLECPGECTGTSFCTANEVVCAGSVLRICNPAGSAYNVETDCAETGLICGPGSCVSPGVCGNDVCEAGESGETCPADCRADQECQPNSATCDGNTLVRCNAAGMVAERTDCADEGLVCGNGLCQPSGVCGNSVCEGDESETCPEDCDAATCGNDVCEAGEPEGCPQDCAELVCVPGERICNGPQLTVCSPSGQSLNTIDCTRYEQTCGRGNCVPPMECGNGVCEAGEFDVCDADCSEVCGDASCRGAETFATCAIDCPPECGDGICNGAESAVTCSVDCLDSCGNDVCEAVEDRASCPNDCGFCGDGVCADGVETRGGTEAYCNIDCVALTCASADDCDDRIDCTLDSCNTELGVCVYTVVNSQCADGEVCLGFQATTASGCCVDADDDGYAALSCGGGDCDDGDPLIHPGALEPCGGGDKNCSGDHRAVFVDPVQITHTTSFKSNLDMARGTNGYLAAWTGQPIDVQHLEVALLSAGGELIGSVHDGGAVTMPAHVAYSAQSDRYGVAWTDGATQGVFQFANSATGALENSPVVGPSGPCNSFGVTTTQYLQPSGLEWVDDTFVITDGLRCSSLSGPEGVGWATVSEAGGMSEPWSGLKNQEVTATALLGDRVAGLALSPTPALMISVVPSDTTAFGSVTLSPASAEGQCIIGWDGAHIAHVCMYDGSVTFNQLALNGATLGSWTLSNESLAPVAMARVGRGLSDDEAAPMAVIAAQGASNLVMFVVAPDGELVIEPGAVAGGVNVTGAHLFVEGQDFVAMWLADADGVQQLFRQTIACQ